MAFLPTISIHHEKGDQLELFAAKQFRDAWLTRDVIAQHLEGQNSFDGTTITRNISSGFGDLALMP